MKSMSRDFQSHIAYVNLLDRRGIIFCLETLQSVVKVTFGFKVISDVSCVNVVLDVWQ